jgi:hypothetical protein
MKKIYFFLGVVLLFPMLSTIAQTPGINETVMLESDASSNNSIILKWSAVTDASSYAVLRKVAGGDNWQILNSALSASTFSYADMDVSQGVSYEYKVTASRPTDPKTAYGYVNTGIKLPAAENRGRLLLLIDDAFASSLASEIERLQLDLIGDGWRVETQFASRTQSPTAIKAIIKNIYDTKPGLTTVFLLGHIPVPYAGAMNPDGHYDHYGAWPADGYYADMDGTWTDETVNVVVASDPRNHNVPGDGKFDQKMFPSNLELEIGRVDMSNLPAFGQSEADLLRFYLDKLHRYKYSLVATANRAVVDDNFTTITASSTGWRNFSGLVGKENTVAENYANSLSDGSHIFSYISGGGTYQSVGGVTTDYFVQGDPNGIFTMMLGSYFADWDTQNNVMRAALASGNILTNLWAGFPNWYFQHMATGKHIGYGVKVSQNNNNAIYAPQGYYARWTHMALMGDPSLKVRYERPAGNLMVSVAEGNALLSWDAPQQAGLLGYYVYKSDSKTGQYARITPTLLTETTFVDECPADGTQYYMVRPMVLNEIGSSSYYELGQGAFVQTDIDASNNCATGSLPVELASFSVEKKDGKGADIVWTTASELGLHYFELQKSADGKHFNAFKSVAAKGAPDQPTTYIVSDAETTDGYNYYRLKAVDKDKSARYSQVRSVYFPFEEMVVFPVPAKDKVSVKLPQSNLGMTNTVVELLDASGKTVANKQKHKEDEVIQFDLEGLGTGVYMLRYFDGNVQRAKRVVIGE